MPISDDLTLSIKPGDDFYHYVNKRWIDEHPIPDDKARIGAFNVLSDENIEKLHGLLKEQAPAGEAANIQVLRRFFGAAMDTEAIEKAGLSAVSPYLDKVAALKDKQGAKKLISGWHALGMSLVWTAFIEPDDKDSARYILRFEQSGLGLPDRDYYTESSKRFEDVRGKYREFLVKFFELMGSGAAEQEADNVLGIEQKLAEASATAVERRDVDAMYNLYTRDELAQKFPGMEWADYFEALQLPDVGEVLISQPNFLGEAFGLLESGSLDAWQSYLRFHLVRPLLSYLPQDYEKLGFSFYGRVLRGAHKQEPRYRRVIGLAEQLLPEPIGQLFVEHYFDESAKKTIYDLVGDIQEAFRVRIGHLEWMSETTKAQALEKLDTFLPLLGYPDTWRDYSKLKLDGSHAANVLEAIAYDWRYDTARIHKPVDRKQWLMSPALVNAYYWPNTNGITFPAAILQPPFFDATGDMVANYGAIGSVIGHEISHGFDDSGSKFDKTGNLKSWWTDEDRAAFDALTVKIKEQYDAYEFHGTHINGALTLGENVADLGGLMVAYDAMQRYLQKTGNSGLIDGFTPEQRFFIAYARTESDIIRPELAHSYLIADTHSPSLFRVNGVVPNVDAFYEAFDVQPGDRLYRAPEERVRIW